MFATRIWIAIAVLVVVVSAALSNARVSNGAGHETRHRVRAGETLWTIAEANYAGDPRKASDRRVLGVLRLNGGVQALNRLDGARLEHAVGLGQGGGALP
jgi:hypothetical protein